MTRRDIVILAATVVVWNFAASYMLTHMLHRPDQFVFPYIHVWARTALDLPNWIPSSIRGFKENTSWIYFGFAWALPSVISLMIVKPILIRTFKIKKTQPSLYGEVEWATPDHMRAGGIISKRLP